MVATQTGPAEAKKGEYVTINYTITNKGSQPVYNVELLDQDFSQTLGTINPGESKNYSHNFYIPTDEQVKGDFGTNATVDNPLFIGGVGVSFNTANGSKYSINANSIEIKLV